MDAKSVGMCIAELRRKRGMTQVELAKRLNISDKAVSRWESGAGYPEITQFPVLASIFGVTVDYLLIGKRRGITIAGNILADIVKMVDCYPEKGMLANIKSITKAVGGCVPNTAIDLTKIDSTIPISACGKIGDDEYGSFVLSKLNLYGVNCSRISVSERHNTSFSDVINPSGGERTFFHSRGANAAFSPEDIDISSLDCSILHIGYILLLDQFDKPDAEYGTVMARFLSEVQRYGIKTSIDVVSDSLADYKTKLKPALKYCDYAILNELECTKLTGLSPYRADGSIDIENIRKTMVYMAECGVRQKVIVHSKVMGFCYDVATGDFTYVPSLDIPDEQIKGNVGAGDAFCAGSLYAIYNGYDDRKLLEFASASAASNLFSENSIDGMLDRKSIEQLAQQYSRRVTGE